MNNTNNSINKWAKDMNRCFTEEDLQAINKHEKIFNLISIKRYANQNYTKIPSHPNWKGIYQEYKQQ